ncbi:Hsp20 family protein, partial [Candidatus Bathyarchaeota archaeon]|nr:Hsp20 family protein [Candidatus Bathyarchaeota archaeon]
MSEEDKTKEMVESPSQEERRITTGTEWTRGIDDLFEDFRRSFDSYMSPFVPMRSFLPRTRGFPVRAPLIDLMDRGDHFLMRAELPGFKKDMVDVELNKDTLVLKAEMRREEEESNQDYLHRERTYSQAQ